MVPSVFVGILLLLDFPSFKTTPSVPGIIVLAKKRSLLQYWHLLTISSGLCSPAPTFQSAMIPGPLGLHPFVVIVFQYVCQRSILYPLRRPGPGMMAQCQSMFCYNSVITALNMRSVDTGLMTEFYIFPMTPPFRHDDDRPNVFASVPTLSPNHPSIFGPRLSNMVPFSKTVCL